MECSEPPTFLALLAEPGQDALAVYSEEVYTCFTELAYSLDYCANKEIQHKHGSLECLALCGTFIVVQCRK